jgi:hypothetical protein
MLVEYLRGGKRIHICLTVHLLTLTSLAAWIGVAAKSEHKFPKNTFLITTKLQEFWKRIILN